MKKLRVLEIGALCHNFWVRRLKHLLCRVDSSLWMRLCWRRSEGEALLKVIKKILECYTEKHPKEAQLQLCCSKFAAFYVCIAQCVLGNCICPKYPRLYIYTVYLTVISRILNFRSILILIFHVVYLAFFEENMSASWGSSLAETT